MPMKNSVQNSGSHLWDTSKDTFNVLLVQVSHTFITAFNFTDLIVGVCVIENITTVCMGNMYGDY